jgi:hypothetical protein
MPWWNMHNFVCCVKMRIKNETKNEKPTNKQRGGAWEGDECYGKQGTPETKREKGKKDKKEKQEAIKMNILEPRVVQNNAVLLGRRSFKNETSQKLKQLKRHKCRRKSDKLVSCLIYSYRLA